MAHQQHGRPTPAWRTFKDVLLAAWLRPGRSLERPLAARIDSGRRMLQVAGSPRCPLADLWLGNRGIRGRIRRRGRRRRLARRTVGAVAVAVLLAAVVVVAALLPERAPRRLAVATGPAPGGVPDGAVPWFEAYLSGNPGELVVSVAAPCRGQDQAVRPLLGGLPAPGRRRARPDGGDRPALPPRAPLPEGHSCTTVGLLLNRTVALPEDLGGRPLVDGATGQRRPLVEGLLTPGVAA